MEQMMKNPGMNQVAEMSNMTQDTLDIFGRIMILYKDISLEMLSKEDAFKLTSHLEGMKESSIKLNQLDKCVDIETAKEVLESKDMNRIRKFEESMSEFVDEMANHMASIDRINEIQCGIVASKPFKYLLMKEANGKLNHPTKIFYEYFTKVRRVADVRAEIKNFYIQNREDIQAAVDKFKQDGFKI